MLQSKARIESTFRVRRQAKSWQNDVPFTMILILLAVVTYVPFASVIVNSFKNNQQFFTQFWLPTLPLHLENYATAWPSIWRSIQNTLLYAVPTLILVLTISGLSGYAFARYRFRGREALFFLMLILIMLPGILLVIPMFTLIVSIGWINTIQSVVLPFTAVQVSFGMFLMRTFFETLPTEYFEAARLDGASELQLFYRIALPLAAPAFSTLAILNLLFVWNDIIWPLIVLLDGSKHPISIGVLSFSGQYTTDYGPLFAGYVLASLPLLIVFAFTARRFMAGLQGGLSI
jgi:ABC-type glycerol-3-phosphate transport system permease component